MGRKENSEASRAQKRREFKNSELKLRRERELIREKDSKENENSEENRNSEQNGNSK